jgi:hypothetical protein
MCIQQTDVAKRKSPACEDSASGADASEISDQSNVPKNKAAGAV